MRPRRSRGPIDFAAVNAAALAALPDLLRRWLPDGVVRGREYVARNPRRRDRRLGSFPVNLDTGRWADFATGDVGGDHTDGIGAPLAKAKPRSRQPPR
jgi:hypothetical protein